MRMHLAVLSNLPTDLNSKQKHVVLFMQLKPFHLDGNFGALTYRSRVYYDRGFVLFFFC